MLFEIINPSDKYTIEAPDLEIAALAVCVLGEGKYALQGIDNTNEVPIFLFGGHDDWFKKKFGRSFGYSLELSDKAKLADCLDSTLIGDANDRKQFNAARTAVSPEVFEGWRAGWTGARCSSLNNIGRRAYAYAEALRDQLA
jgi:hypothetical protein